MDFRDLEDLEPDKHLWWAEWHIAMARQKGGWSEDAAMHVCGAAMLLNKEMNDAKET